MAVACQSEGNREIRCLPTEKFRNGDLVFRRGTGITSRVVLAANGRGSYSHAGVLKKEGEKWHVIHAVPDEPDFPGDVDRVKKEPVEAFFTHGRAARGAVMRVSGDTAVAQRAAGHADALYQAGILFDHAYDLTDTTALYCTELIDLIYRSEGIDLPEGRSTPVHLPGMNGTYLLPDDLASSSRLELIYSF